MTLTCGECSPGGAHPIFNSESAYRSHRTQSHGETFLDEIIPAIIPGADHAGELLGEIHALIADHAALKIDERLTAIETRLSSIEDRVTAIEAQVLLDSSLLSGFDSRIAALEAAAAPPAGVAQNVSLSAPDRPE